jgi:hypothetical protein
MPIKIENKTVTALPRSTARVIQSAFDAIPREHQRGLARVVLVDRINPDPRLQLPGAVDLPGLYHPRAAASPPWIEIALSSLLPSDGFFKRLAGRLNYNANLAGLVISLLAQHYHLTLSHGIKKHQYEGAIRVYMEKYHAVWRERQGGVRARLFKPFRPWLDRWARDLRKKYDAEQKRRAAG